MRITITIPVLAVVSVCIAQSHQDNSIGYQISKQSIVDKGPIYYELSYADCKSLIPQRGDETITEASLSLEEFKLMKTILLKAVKQHNRRVHNNKDFRIDLEVFGVQYIAYLTSKGEKFVWINGFDIKGNETFYPKQKTNFHSHIIGFDVLDGGNGYFNTLINLSKNGTAPIRIHGFA